MTPPLRAVSFDAHDTLLVMADPAPLLRDALRRRLGLRLPVERCRAGMRAEIRAYHALPAAGDQRTLAVVRARCATVLAEALASGAAGPELEPCLLDAVRFLPAPGARAALATVRSAGLRTAVVSNWDVSLREHLASSGLAALVDVLVLSSEVGVAKPAPGIFRIAAARLGVAAQQVLHVGDHPRHDVDTARAAGLRALLVTAAPVPVRAPYARDLGAAARLAVAQLG